jgi:hypothetical protein
MYKKIEFVPINELVENIVDPPKPAINFIPDWYRNMSSYIEENTKVFRYPNSKESNLTLKKCMPFFDTLTSGYMITLPCDIVFVDPEQYNGNRIIWDTSFNPIGTHSMKQLKNMPLPENKNFIWKWNFDYIIKTPPGYSCLFFHPKYRYDLPFLTLDGFVDTDTHEVPINFPFLISDNFKGKIKKGTPICQILPIKRDNWRMSKQKVLQENKFVFEKFTLMVENYYKKMFWHKKEYK